MHEYEAESIDYRHVLQNHVYVCLCATSWRMVCHTEKARGHFLMRATSQIARSHQLTQLGATL